MPQKAASRYRPRRSKGRTEVHYPLPYVLLLAIPAALLGLFRLFRGNEAVMNWIIRHITSPYQRGVSWLADWVPLSLAELFYGVAIVALLLFVVRSIVLLVKRPGKLTRLVRRIVVLGAAVLIFYTGFTLLWGVNYYGSTFSEESGLERRGATAQELYQLTVSFIQEANDLADSVTRDEDGLFAEPDANIFADSATIYEGISQEYPFLSGYVRSPKPMVTSRLLSYLDFTGFYFPFTGEATLNVDAPSCLLPATVAHELSHQRGIANEDEANFVAILACLRSGNTTYRYSGCLMGYIHLSNALYKADKALWQQAHDQLSASVLADIQQNNSYWAQIKSTLPGSTATQVSNTVYSSFAASYGEEDVMQRYGACVELLVAYYFDQ
jgi:hypothetical protein